MKPPKVLSFFESFIIIVTLCELSIHTCAKNFSSSLRNQIIGGHTSFDRPFYVRIRYTDEVSEYHEYVFCGGVLIDRLWIVTAPRCVNGLEPDNIFIEARDFSTANKRELEIGLITEIVFRPTHEVALLHLMNPFSSLYQPIPICPTKVPDGTTLAAAGMGAVAKNRLVVPKFLQEMMLFSWKYSSLNVFTARNCPDWQVCAFSLPHQYTSVCYMDQGGPLYKLHCGTLRPECLYGIIAHFQTNGNQACTGTLFSSMPYHSDWINLTMQVRRRPLFAPVDEHSDNEKRN